MPRSKPLPDRLALTDMEVPLPVESAAPLPPSPVLAFDVGFEINSSFLSAPAIADLRRAVAGLPQGGSYRVELTATVSDDGVKEADAKAAQRYNRWLAERRIARVGDWLQQHSRTRLAVHASYLPHDPSRRVVVRLKPVDRDHHAAR